MPLSLPLYRSSEAVPLPLLLLFYRSSEAVPLPLLLLLYLSSEAVPLPLSYRFTALQRFLLPLFLSFHRSSEAFICSSFFVYFIYERLVVVGQQGEPIVADCLKSNMGGAQEGGFRHGHLFDLGNVDDQWARQATFVYVEGAFVSYDVCGVDGAFNGDQGCHGKACADDGPCACVLPEASKGTDGMQRYGGDVLQGYTAMECSVHIVLKWQSSCQLVKLST